MKASSQGLVELLTLTGHLGSSAQSRFSRTCADSCQNALLPVRFSDMPPLAPYEEQRCRSRLSLTSTFLCLDRNCGEPTLSAALQSMNATCQTHFNISVPEFSRLANYTEEEVLRMPRLHRNDTLGPQEPWREPVLPAADYFTGWFQTLVRMPEGEKALSNQTFRWR